MAPDCIYNFTGLAYSNLQGAFIMNFIFIAFLLMCIILLCVQLVTVCDWLYFYKHFKTTFKKIYRVFKIVLGLYRVARQCHQFYVPKLRPKKTTQGLSQQLVQNSPPRDECIPVLQNRLILICLPEQSPLLAPPTPQIPALQQDQVMDKFVTETSSELLTPIRQVQPLLGTTHRENLQLQNRNTPEDIADVLRTTAFQGYVSTPLQTLDGIVVQQPKRFLPLAEEAKHFVEEIHIEKLNEQWADIPHEKLLNQSFRDQLNSTDFRTACTIRASKTTPSGRYHRHFRTIRQS